MDVLLLNLSFSKLNCKIPSLPDVPTDSCSNAHHILKFQLEYHLVYKKERS